MSSRRATFNPIARTPSGTEHDVHEGNGPAPEGEKIGSVAVRHPRNSSRTQTPAEYDAAIRNAVHYPGFERSPTVLQAIVNAMMLAEEVNADRVEFQKKGKRLFAKICTAATCILVPLLLIAGAAVLRGGTRRRSRSDQRRGTRRLRSDRLKPAF